MFIGFTSKLIRTITFSRVVIWTLTALLAVVFFTLYENRAKIVTTITAPKVEVERATIFAVGEDTDRRLQELVADERLAIGVIVSNADLRINETAIMYWYTESASLNLIGETIKRSADLRRLPLFSSSDKANDNIIGLINGQFVCSEFEHTVISKIYPEMNAEVKAVCSSSIPSYYGYFSGTVTLLLTAMPSLEKQQQLKLVTEKIANDIYFNDIQKARRMQ